MPWATSRPSSWGKTRGVSRMKLDAKELNQVLFDKEERQPSVSFFAGNRKKSVSLDLVCSV